MSRSQTSPGGGFAQFWTTLPGVLTGIAALVGAGVGALKLVDELGLLREATGEISVQSNPPGAEVLVDGTLYGATGEEPLVISDLEPGRYQVRLVRDGVDLWEQFVDVAPRGRHAIVAALEAAPPPGTANASAAQGTAGSGGARTAGSGGGATMGSGGASGAVRPSGATTGPAAGASTTGAASSGAGSGGGEVGAGGVSAVALSAPRPVAPACNAVLDASRERGVHFSWRPVEGAGFYELEADCYGCRGAEQSWYSESGRPWHLRTGLGTRSPIYNGSGVDTLFARAGGRGRLRWRVRAIAPDGADGPWSEWCMFALRL